MKADMRNKKFASNVHRENNFNVLKTTGVYGTNNVGKTCLVKCIRAIKSVLLDKESGLLRNIFSDNELNNNAQMIFTVHDINLMDCKRMFRKEQIWFVHRDEEGVYMYSLADFTAQEGVRDTTDVMEKYRKGALGALPDSELIKSLLSIKGNAKGVVADAE